MTHLHGGNGRCGSSVAELIARRQPFYSLEQAFYTSEAVYRAELHRVFRRSWLYAGHISEIPRAGDYLTYSLGNDSVILIRGEDGAVHALANVCRHRGSRLCSEHRGHAGKLVCPYHQWVYGADGSLLSAKHMPEGFDPAGFSLAQVHVRNLEGLLFVCLGDPPDFTGVERDIVPQLQPHGLARARIAHREVFDLRGNWKLAMENWRECYHCAVGHPEFCRVTGADHMFASERGRQAYNQREAARRERWNSTGLPTRYIALDPHRNFYAVNRYALADGCVTESMDGKQVAPLMGTILDADAGTLGVNIFPIFSVQVHCDYAFVLNMKPTAIDRTAYEILWLVREDAVEGRDYDLRTLTEFWRVTAAQDVALIEANQLGVVSPRYVPGPLSAIEREHMELFIRWYLHALAAEE